MAETKTTVSKPADDFMQIQELWGMFLPRWHWFIASIFVALAVAFFYLMKTTPIYTRTATILIKDDSKGGSSINGMSEFSDMGIFKSNTNINNELLTLKSPTLMIDVVNRLGLNETYTVRRGLKRVGLYKLNPVAVTYLQKIEQPVNFTIRIDSEDTFTLSDFVISGQETDESYSGHLNDSICTSVGMLSVVSTSHFNESYIGSSIKYSRGGVLPFADAYCAMLRVELGSKEASVINLSIDDASIQKAEDILNTLIEVYNERWIQDKNQIAVSTSQFIGDRLSVIERELGHVDENISSYKSQHLLPDVQAASSLYMAQSAENKKQLLVLNNQLSTAKYIRTELSNKNMSQPLPTNSGLASSNIESQIGEYNSMVLERNRLIASSSEKNPLVMDLANSLQAIKHTIIQSLDNLIVSINTQIRSITQQEAATTSQLASNPNQAKYLLSVERQQKVKEQLYLYLLQKREENELSQAFTAYNTRVITAPRGSMAPTAPRRMNILLIAFALGLLGPGVIIYMQETMNTKLRGRKDLENLSIPIIGEIPQYLKHHRHFKFSDIFTAEFYTVAYFKERFFTSKAKNVLRMTDTLVKEGKRDIINEAFRVLRSNMDFMINKEEHQNVIVITSFNPGSGKSFLTVNIALSYAIKHKKVLLIDGDLRHGSTSQYVDSPKLGLSEYLNGHSDNIQQYLVVDKKYSNLHVLPIGKIPPNPTELLENGRFGSLVEQLRSEYDLILIDCPPIDIVADTQIIEKYADRSIFVVRAGLLDRAMLPELESIYQEKRFKNLSLILNGTESAGGRYAYRYGYRYGYHYGYRYGYHANSYYGNEDDEA